MLFKKTRKTDKACVDILKQRLEEYYPDTALVYQPSYFLALAEFDDSMVYYNFREDTLLFSKYPGQSPQFTLNNTSPFSELSFEVTNNTTGLTLLVENQNGEVYRSALVVQERAPYSIDITESDFLTVSVISEEGAEETPVQYTLHFQQSSLH